MLKDRKAAGQLLADKLKNRLFSFKKNKIVVLGISRGGLVVAKEIAQVLKLALDVIVVKKIGAPSNNELAIGAIGETKGSRYFDAHLIKQVGADRKYLEQEIKIQKLAIKRREKIYRQNKKALDLKNKVVIIVDDGAATGATMIAAAREVWNNQPKKVIIALPILAKDILAKLEQEADEVIYLEAPGLFYAVEQFYEEFPQKSDEEVMKILREG